MRVKCEEEKVRDRCLVGCKMKGSGGGVTVPMLLRTQLAKRWGKGMHADRVMSQWNYFLGSFPGQYVPTPLQPS